MDPSLGLNPSCDVVCREAEAAGSGRTSMPKVGPMSQRDHGFGELIRRRSVKTPGALAEGVLAERPYGRLRTERSGPVPSSNLMSASRETTGAGECRTQWFISRSGPRIRTRPGSFFGQLFGWTFPDGGMPGYTYVDTGVEGAVPGGISPLQGGALP
jgi:hypothetical protein